MDVSIIYVNWKSVNYIRQSIRSVYEHTREILLEIIVVDNASPDDDVDSLRLEFPEVILIKSGENLGFGRANNLGAQTAQGRYLLFLNPDTKLLNPAITSMMQAAASRPDCG